MKILAISDIHNNLKAVEQVFQQVKDQSFDVILSAGDFGSLESGSKIFEIFEPLSIPFLYVLGNWDHKIPYDHVFTKQSVHLHLNVVELKGWYFCGFSGCTANGFRGHPKFRLGGKASGQKEKKAMVDSSVFELRQLLSKSAIPLDRTIVVTHERITFLEKRGFIPFLHTFGHRHKFSFTKPKKVNYLNMAAVDMSSSPFNVSDTPTWKELGYKSQKEWGIDGRPGLTGNYCIISLDEAGIDARTFDIPTIIRKSQ